MKKILPVLFLFIYALPYCQSQHALLIGINRYAPPKDAALSGSRSPLAFNDLQGCVNDMEAMYGIVKDKFHFNGVIDTLTNEAATRQAILTGMDKLLARCQPGDVAFIYYGGHGSQVRNSLSASKADKMDETIVPADAWKKDVPDIRDKELSKIFNAFIDKKVKLTVILDCCHSGSMSRGPNIKPGKLRYMPAEDWDAKDPSSPTPPETRAGGNFLIFSACQADEYASELLECVDATNYIPHGAFTMALAEALRQQPADASALAIFMSARAIMKNNGATQEPVIEGLPGRQSQTLFGISKGKALDYSTIPVIEVKDDKVVLEGGWALGLFKENELSLINDADKNDTIFKLHVDNVTGVNKCEASVIKGDITKIKPGNLFKVTNWASGDIPLLNVYIPASQYSNDEITKITKLAAQLKTSGKVTWLENLKGQSPYVSIFFDSGKCFAKVDTLQPKELKDVTAQSIISLCKGGTLYFEIPVSKDSSDAFIHTLQPNRNINIVQNIDAANYSLYGKLGKNNLPAYGFRKCRIKTADSLESMPLFTDCFEYQVNSSKSVADSLFLTAQKLSKLRGWLNVIQSPQGTEKIFPFHLEFINLSTKRAINGKYAVGDSVRPVIVADSDFVQYQASITPKYVYVFGVDQGGNMSLYFPISGNGNTGNKLPVYDKEKLYDTMPIFIPYRVTAPTGTDNFFVLATNEAIINADQLFNQEGVNTDAVSRGVGKGNYNKNPLSALLDVGNFSKTSASRGLPPGRLPASWCLQKFSYKCTY